VARNDSCIWWLGCAGAWNLWDINSYITLRPIFFWQSLPRSPHPLHPRDMVRQSREDVRLEACRTTFHTIPGCPCFQRDARLRQLCAILMSVIGTISFVHKNRITCSISSARIRIDKTGHCAVFELRKELTKLYPVCYVISLLSPLGLVHELLQYLVVALANLLAGVFPVGVNSAFFHRPTYRRPFESEVVWHDIRDARIRVSVALENGALTLRTSDPVVEVLFPRDVTQLGVLATIGEHGRGF
jgi:hypothetical protein